MPISCTVVGHLDSVLTRLLRAQRITGEQIMDNSHGSQTVQHDTCNCLQQPRAERRKIHITLLLLLLAFVHSKVAFLLLLFAFAHSKVAHGRNQDLALAAKGGDHSLGGLDHVWHVTRGHQQRPQRRLLGLHSITSVHTRSTSSLHFSLIPSKLRARQVQLVLQLHSVTNQRVDGLCRHRLVTTNSLHVSQTKPPLAFHLTVLRKSCLHFASSFSKGTLAKGLFTESVSHSFLRTGDQYCL